MAGRRSKKKATRGKKREFIERASPRGKDWPDKHPLRLLRKKYHLSMEQLAALAVDEHGVPMVHSTLVRVENGLDCMISNFWRLERVFPPGELTFEMMRPKATEAPRGGALRSITRRTGHLLEVAHSVPGKTRADR